MSDVERLFVRLSERVIETLYEMTKQISRVAHALERQVVMGIQDPQIKKCPSCMSQIQRYDAKQCLACGEAMNDG